MKKSLAIACLISLFAVSSFAQSSSPATPTAAGVKLVAERDAAWHKAHPVSVQVVAPVAHHGRRHVTRHAHLHRRHLRHHHHNTHR